MSRRLSPTFPLGIQLLAPVVLTCRCKPATPTTAISPGVVARLTWTAESSFAFFGISYPLSLRPSTDPTKRTQLGAIRCIQIIRGKSLKCLFLLYNCYTMRLDATPKFRTPPPPTLIEPPFWRLCHFLISVASNRGASSTEPNAVGRQTNPKRRAGP